MADQADTATNEGIATLDVQELAAKLVALPEPGRTQLLEKMEELMLERKREEARLELEARSSALRTAYQGIKEVLAKDLLMLDRSSGGRLGPYISELLDEVFLLMNPFDAEHHPLLKDHALYSVERMRKIVEMRQHPFGSTLQDTLYRVAQIGTAVEYMESRRQPGFEKAVVCVAAATQKLYPSKYAPRKLPDDLTRTTPEQRRQGASLTEYDKYIRDWVLGTEGLGQVLDIRKEDFALVVSKERIISIPPECVGSLPQADEADYRQFYEQLVKRNGATIYSELVRRSEKGRIAASLPAQILRDWLPRALWRLPTKEAVQLVIIGRRTNIHDGRSYNEAVRRLGLRESRQKN